MKKFLFFTLLVIGVQLQSCYITRAFKHRKFELKDLDKLENIILPATENPFRFTENVNKPSKLTQFLDSTLNNTYTYSFLVIRNDSILYEKYFDEIKATTKQPSFSVAKSFIGTLVQMAVEDGFIKNLQEPITNYLPHLNDRDEAFTNITIQHVMDMASGIKSVENYGNPFSDVLHMGFTKNLNNRLKKLRIETAPGKFDYKSVNTQLLASIIEISTKQKLQDYFVKKLWLPLGMENEASWNVDSKKNTTPRAFCCINATTRDFAKLGKLYLQKGNYNGKQLISEYYILQTTNPDAMQKNDGYKNQWWAVQPYIYFTDSLKAVDFITSTPKTSYHKKVDYKGQTYFVAKDELAPYYAQGILEQFVYVNPRTNTIIVRLGHYWNHKRYSTMDVISMANRVANY